MGSRRQRIVPIIVIIVVVMAAIASTFLLSLAVVRHLYTNQHERNVLVIGAGLSGVAAARHLTDNINNFRVSVFEARDRIGGRIHTLWQNNTPIELGAMFIHKHKNNPITGLARRFNLTTVPFDYFRSTYYDEDGAAIPFETWNSTYHLWRETIFDDFMDFRDERYNADLDQPMSLTLDDMEFYEELSPLEQRVFDLFCFQYIVQDVQANVQDISSNEYDESLEFLGGHNSDLILPGGYEGIVRGLAEGLDIHLNRYVNSITTRSRWSGVEVSWRGAAKTDTRQPFSHVIVTVPIGVLKRHTRANDKSVLLHFDPPLPVELRTSIADLGLSDTIKVALCWKSDTDVFWPHHGTRTTHFHKFAHKTKRTSNSTSRYGRGEHFEFVNLHDIYNNRCLLMETETQFAHNLNALFQANRTDALTKRIMEDLCQMFPTNCTPPNAGVYVSDWSSSDTTLGGFAHWRVDTGSEENDVFVERSYHFGRLHFAGEHTNSDYYGNTHGSYLSGVEAAGRVAAAVWRLEMTMAAAVSVGVAVTVLAALKVFMYMFSRFVHCGDATTSRAKRD
eukprot:PhM_4_TR11898/c0_g1_i1/m.42725/K17839/PAO4, PAO3, PAO2; polyamine oxidase